MRSLIAIVALAVLGIAFGQDTFNRELFAVVGAGHCAESLAFGSQAITTTGSADGLNEYYLSTSGTKANRRHTRWLQIVTNEGSTEVFRIYWTFDQPRTLSDRLLYATSNSDEAVTFTIVDTANAGGGGTGSVVEGSATWSFSTASGLTAEKLAAGGTSLSNSGGVWGRDNGVQIDGSDVPTAGGFWGIGNYVGNDDSQCNNIYANSAVYSTATTTKVYMYVLDDIFAVVGGSECAQSLRFGPSVLSPAGSQDGNRYYLYTTPGSAEENQNEWLQISSADGVTEDFRITWSFANPRPLVDTFATAVASGVVVNYHVVNTAGVSGDTAGAAYDFTGIWRFSDQAGNMVTQFSSSGTAFSADDGAWGGASGTIDADTSSVPANYWGLGNFAGTSDVGCQNLYANGAVYASSANTVTTMYVSDSNFAPTGRPTGQPTSQPTNPTSQPTSSPTTQPTSQPTRQPTGQPSSQPSRQPTSQPSSQPTSAPTRLAKKRRYRLPVVAP